MGALQRNSIRSWLSLDRDVEVILIGDEEGVAEAAADLGARHLAGVRLTEQGTPRIDNAFALTAQVALHPVHCFVNADIILLDDFVAALTECRAYAERFLMIGETRDLAVAGELEDFTSASLRRSAAVAGRSRGPTAIDYFVFTPGLFDPVPPFAGGRARFDNWLVWRARQTSPVIDATKAVVAIHQSHDYAHLGGGLDEAHFGEEARTNERLAGGSRRAYTIHDASHTLGADGRVRRNPGSILRVREGARKVAWKLGRRFGR
jgi:hypothetical protein